MLDPPLLPRGRWPRDLRRARRRRPRPRCSALPGVVDAPDERPARGRRSKVYGVDERFWAFHGAPAPARSDGRRRCSARGAGRRAGRAGGRRAAGARARRRPTCPGSSLFGRRDDPGALAAPHVPGRSAAAELGEFALRPRQQAVRARLRSAARCCSASLGARGPRQHACWSRARPRGRGAGERARRRRAVRLEDLGLRLRPLPRAARARRSRARARLLERRDVEAARARGARGGPATAAACSSTSPTRSGSAGARCRTRSSRPSSRGFVARRRGAAADRRAARRSCSTTGRRGSWAPPGDTVVLEYYVWRRRAGSRRARPPSDCAGVVPLAGAAADRDLVPDYPGITESAHLSDWDPPFPGRPRADPAAGRGVLGPHRTTPKAFVPLADGPAALGPSPGPAHLDAARARRRARDLAGRRPSADCARRCGRAARSALARAASSSPCAPQALAAARGATDFGAYFLYFSVFLVVSALLLAGLFFRLGLEQRLAEIGLLRALGFSGAACGACSWPRASS